MDPLGSGPALVKSVASGFSWNVGGSVARAVCSFFLNIALARLLGPAPFGVIALATVVIGLGGMLLDWGLSYALVQRAELEAHDVTYVFAFQMALGFCLSLLVAAIAPSLARFFGNAALTGVLRALSPALFIQAFGQASSALLIRRMNFRRLQEAQLLSYLVGYLGVGLPLALWGNGVWSLVAAQLVQTLANTLILFFSAPHSLALDFHPSSDLMRFGSRSLGASLASWVIPNLQNAIIGWRFGAIDLGFYGRSYNLSLTPVGVLVNSAQSVLFPAISELGKGPRASKLFVSFLGAFCVLLIPGYAVVALGAREIILLLYGEAWLPAAVLLTPLALAMLAFSFSEMAPPVLKGLGLPQTQMRIEWAVTAAALVVLLGASQVSLATTAWAVLLIYLLRLILMSTQTVRALGLGGWSLLHPVLAGLLLAAAACAGWALARASVPIAMALAWQVLIQSVAALIFWAVALLLGRRLFFPELGEAFRYVLALRKAGSP